MKKVFLSIILIAVFVMSGCAMFQPVVKKKAITDPTEAVMAAESAAATDEGIFIKIDKAGESQRKLIEAVYVLEDRYGIPLFLVSGDLVTMENGTEISVIRYTLHFKMSEDMCTVVSISNGKIRSITPTITPISKSGKMLAAEEIPIKKVLKAAGVELEQE